MSTREKLSSPFTKDNKRSDSPGYFTLSSNSGSDTGDCTGDISCEEDEELIHLRQHDSSLSHHCNDDNFADSSSSTIVYNFQNSLNTSDEKNRGLARISRENTASPSRKNTPPVKRQLDNCLAFKNLERRDFQICWEKCPDDEWSGLNNINLWSL